MMADDQQQAIAAGQVLRDATVIALTLPCLCELVWVLRKVYGRSRADAAIAIRQFLDADGVEVDRPAVDAGLSMLDAGGDFADGVIAYEGRWLGGEEFVSFDRQAVTQLRASGVQARLL